MAGRGENEELAAPGDKASSADAEQASFRYGIVLLLIVALVVFAIVTPSANWSRAIGFGIEVCALAVVAATSRARAHARTAEAIVVALSGFAFAALLWAGVVPLSISFAASGLLAAAIPFTITGGVLRLLRTRGVTVQAVAGALAVYLLVGVLFAWLIGLVERLQGTPFFAQQHAVSSSAAIYYSFTVMTTTGFGDLTAATRVGRSLAVLEMLLGQIYVVVVIGLLVGNMRSRARG